MLSIYQGMLKNDRNDKMWNVKMRKRKVSAWPGVKDAVLCDLEMIHHLLT
jgi:hypothetical protein